jgi:quercetin dioxygenase-like cupin family protein
MLKNAIRITAIVLAVGATADAQAPRSGGAAAPTVTRTVLRQEDLVNNAGFAVAMVRVDLPPGAREGVHFHPGSLVAVVEAGHMSLDVDNNGKMETMHYEVGDTFYVQPKRFHEGHNDGTIPVKLLASFVFPKDQAMTIQKQ